jgi:hypothetical protein
VRLFVAAFVVVVVVVEVVMVVAVMVVVVMVVVVVVVDIMVGEEAEVVAQVFFIPILVGPLVPAAVAEMVLPF